MNQVTDTYQKPTYQPAPHKPARFDEGLRLIAGTNPHGESNLIISWGMDVRSFRSGNPQAIKYVNPLTGLGMPFWILEEWWKPERLGTREEWENNRFDGKVDLLGSYPNQGLYWMFHQPLISETGGTPELNDRTLEYIAMLWKGRLEPSTDEAENARRYGVIQARAAEAEAAAKRRADAEMDAEWEQVKQNWEQNEAKKNKSYLFGNKEREIASSGEVMSKGGIILPKGWINQ